MYQIFHQLKLIKINNMEINLVALIITVAVFMFGFILGVAVGKFDNDIDNWGI